MMMPLIPSNEPKPVSHEKVADFLERQPTQPEFTVGDAVFVSTLKVGIGYVEELEWNRNGAGPWWFYYVKIDDTNLWMSERSIRRVAGV